MSSRSLRLGRPVSLLIAASAVALLAACGSDSDDVTAASSGPSAGGTGGTGGSASGASGSTSAGTAGTAGVAGAAGTAGVEGVAGSAQAGAGAGGVSGSGGHAGNAGESAAGNAGSGGDSGGSSGASGGGCAWPSSGSIDAMRASCVFTAGAMPVDTLGISATQQKAIPIKHIIVMMKENRAFDHLLGHLNSQGQPDSEPIPASFSNLDLTGATVTPFHEETTCVAHDPGHQWYEMHNQVDGGKMDGFVTSAANTTGSDGHFAIGWYDQTDLPFYYFLANTYAINDRHFASVRSGTFPDRDFMMFGTADGVSCTGCGYPDKTLASIFSEMTSAGVTWGAYTDGDYFSGALGTPESYFDKSHLRGGILTGKKEFFADLMTADFPSVVFVDGDDNVTDEHPTANVQQGEDWSRQIYQAVLASPHWQDMALLWTYDEAGGFADHVPPPPNDPAATKVCTDGNGKDGPKFFELGVRVPMGVISPYARPHYVSHVVQEHTAITRFIETVFDLPALTNRDANSDALLDMFDFDCGPELLTPTVAPAAGVNGCGTNTVHLTTDKPIYAPGDPIQVTFTNGPGNNDLDWIAVYNYGDTPHSGSLVWTRIDGEHTSTPMACPAGCPTTNTVTLMSGDENTGDWPLPTGQYIVYYLLNDAYMSIGSVDFIVQ